MGIWPSHFCITSQTGPLTHSGLQGIALLGVPLNPQLTGGPSELSFEGNGIREMGREWPMSEIVSELASLWETQ